MKRRIPQDSRPHCGDGRRRLHCMAQTVDKCGLASGPPHTASGPCPARACATRHAGGRSARALVREGSRETTATARPMAAAHTSAVLGVDGAQSMCVVIAVGHPTRKRRPPHRQPPESHATFRYIRRLAIATGGSRGVVLATQLAARLPEGCAARGPTADHRAQATRGLAPPAHTLLRWPAPPSRTQTSA